MSMFRDPSVPLTEDQRLMRKRVLHQIESEPETFDMSTWESMVLDYDAQEMCGTTRCIAGWAVYFDHQDKPTDGLPWTSYSDAGIRLLGLTPEECAGDRGEPLFLTSNDDALERLRKLAEG